MPIQKSKIFKPFRIITTRIANEIEILTKETGINHVEFTDSIFNVPLNHAKDVLRAIIMKNLNLKLHTMGLTPAAVDEELLDLMIKAGFNEVDIGAESTCDKILESLGKDFKREDIINTANLLKKKKIAATWFIMLGSPAETRETLIETMKTICRIASKRDLIFVSTGVRVYNGSVIADEMLKHDKQCNSDNFFHPVKIEPEGISLEEIHIIAKRFSYIYPNFYFYEKEHIIRGWLLITGNLLLKLLHSRQPVWRLLLLLKRIERILGINLVKRLLFELKMRSYNKQNKITTGFSLITPKKITL